MSKEAYSQREAVDASLASITESVRVVKEDTDALPMEVRAVQEQVAVLGMNSPQLVTAMSALQARAVKLADSVEALRAGVPANTAAVPVPEAIISTDPTTAPEVPAHPATHATRADRPR
jgi:hypothetical protein